MSTEEQNIRRRDPFDGLFGEPESEDEDYIEEEQIDTPRILGDENEYHDEQEVYVVRFEVEEYRAPTLTMITLSGGASESEDSPYELELVDEANLAESPLSSPIPSFEDEANEYTYRASNAKPPVQDQPDKKLESEEKAK